MIHLRLWLLSFVYIAVVGCAGEKAMVQPGLIVSNVAKNGLNQETPELPDWISLKKSAPLAGKVFDDIWWDTDEDIQDTPFRFEFFNDTDFRVTGGEAGDGFDGTYEQVDMTVYLKMKGNTWKATYDGNEFSLGGDELPGYAGFYREEIKRISMLGDGKDLDWALTKQGLMIKTPEKTGEHAYVFKIERYHHPKLD